MIYARTHDQIVAEDYFAAMQRVEERLSIVLEPKQETEDEVVKVQESEKLFQRIEQLEIPDLCLDERLYIASQLSKLLGFTRKHTIPKDFIQLNYKAPYNT